MSHWSESYFGRLYGEIYRNGLLSDEDTLAEASFAAEVLDLGKRRVLDVACGHGRHSRYLAAGNDVVGIDRNADYLRLASEAIPARRAAHAHFLRGDMRFLPLRAASFDAAVLLFNSFGYFGGQTASPPQTDGTSTAAPVWKLPQVFYDRGLVDEKFGFQEKAESGLAKTTSPVDQLNIAGMRDDQAVLEEISRVLKPQGKLLIELRNPYAISQAVQENPRRIIAGDGFEVREDFSWDISQSVLHTFTHFVWGDDSETSGYSIRLYSRPEMESMLNAAGLRILKTYGDYAGARYHPKASDYLLIVAARRR